jgi:uncharacterized protein YycO
MTEKKEADIIDITEKKEAKIVDVVEQRGQQPAKDSTPRMGDIFLQSRKGFVGWAIRRVEKRLFGTSGKFSHGGIIFDEDTIVDSTYSFRKINGVTMRPRREAFKNSDVMIGRIWPEVTEEDILRAWSRTAGPAMRDGVKYDFKVLTSVGRSHRYDRMFCTDLVWEFYKEAIRQNLDVPMMRLVCPTPDEIAFMVDPIRFSGSDAREIYQGIMRRKPQERGVV